MTRDRSFRRLRGEDTRNHERTLPHVQDDASRPARQAPRPAPSHLPFLPLLAVSSPWPRAQTGPRPAVAAHAGPAGALPLRPLRAHLPAVARRGNPGPARQRAWWGARHVVLAAVCWGLGLSTRATSQILKAFAITLSHLRVWREARALGGELRRQPGGRAVPVLGVDGTGERVASQQANLVWAVGLGTRVPVALTGRDEHDTAALTAGLAQVGVPLGVEVVVTDELESYGMAAEAVQLTHSTAASTGQGARRCSGSGVPTRLPELRGVPFARERPAARTPLIESVGVRRRDRSPEGGLAAAGTGTADPGPL